MSYHISNVLEGWESDPNEDAWVSDYLSTPYGFMVYEVIGGGGESFEDFKPEYRPVWPLPPVRGGG